MAQYRKKPVIVEATQWFRNGDHPEDNSMRPYENGLIPTEPREGTVVRYYRYPGIPGDHPCPHCGIRRQEHGWIDTLEGGHIVCPGDYVITGVAGEFYPCKPSIFERTYDLVVPS